MRSVSKRKLEFLFQENILLYVLILALGILLVVQYLLDGASFVSFFSSPSPVVKQAIVIGKHIPALELETLAGNTVDLSKVQGDFVLLIFLHSECEFCHKDVPLWKKIEAIAEKKNTKLFGVSREISLRKLARFKDEYSVSFPILIDSEGKLFEAGAVDFTPTKILYTKEREIVQVWRGWTNQSSGESELGALRLLFEIYPQELPKYSDHLSLVD